MWISLILTYLFSVACIIVMVDNACLLIIHLWFFDAENTFLDVQLDIIYIFSMTIDLGRCHMLTVTLGLCDHGASALHFIVI